MASVQESIEVNVPVSTAYNQWTQFETFPGFMKGVVSTDKPRNAGTVTFEPLGAERARVSVELEWEPEGLVEKAGSAVGADSRQVTADAPLPR